MSMRFESNHQSDISPIPSLHELVTDDLLEAERQHLLLRVAPQYLLEMAAARESAEEYIDDMDDEKPRVEDYENLDDYAEAMNVWLPKDVENADLDYRKQLGLSQLGYPNNLKCWFMSEGTYDVDHSEKAGAGMLRNYKASEPKFWSRCEAQVSRHQHIAKVLEAALSSHEAIKHAKILDIEAYEKSKASVDQASTLSIVESWITDRFMVDVIEDMLETNLTVDPVLNEAVYANIETLFT
jgi:hypothetical protein